MTGETQVFRDGQLGFAGGADSLTHPLLLRPDKAAMACNVSFRGGFASSRPGYTQQGLTFRRDSYYTWFKTKSIQGWGVYNNGDTTEAIVSVSGRIFACDLKLLEIYERTPIASTPSSTTSNIPAIGSTIDVIVENVFGFEVGHPVFINSYEYTISAINEKIVTLTNVDDTRAGEIMGNQNVVHLLPNVSFADQVWMQQAEQYFIIQDGGKSSAIIFDGPTNRRADKTKKEVPPGRMMAYGHGRLWVATGDNEVIAGDIVGSSTGVLRFTENTYLNEGGTFKIPTDHGKIRAMRFVNTLDTSLGQGPLLVATTEAIFSLNAPTDRDVWKNLTDPIQTYAMVNYGVESHQSAVLVNGDMFYRSKDGIRSFIMARREFGTWGNVPVSSEMQDIIKDDDEKLIKYVSAILFDNRLLFTVNPRLFKERPYFRAIGSLDFAPISSMGVKGRPVYDMMWTGIWPVGLFVADIDGEDRAYAWVVNADDHIELWEITKDNDFDNDDGRITSYVESRSYAFNTPFELKRLIRGELFFEDVKGDVDITVYYRPDGNACWTEWTTLSLCQQYRSCSTDTSTCNTITVYQPGYRNRLKLSEPAFATTGSTDGPTRDFYSAQVRVEWEGKVQLTKFLLVAEQTVEDTGYPDDN